MTTRSLYAPGVTLVMVSISLSASRSFCKTGMLMRSSGMMRTVSFTAIGIVLGIVTDMFNECVPSALLSISNVSESEPFWFGEMVIVMFES